MQINILLLRRVTFSVPLAVFWSNNTQVTVFCSTYNTHVYLYLTFITVYFTAAAVTAINTHFRSFSPKLWLMAFINKSRAYKHKVLLESSSDDIDFSVSISSYKRTTGYKSINITKYNIVFVYLRLELIARQTFYYFSIKLIYYKKVYHIFTRDTHKHVCLYA